MFTEILKQSRIALKLLVYLTLLTGVVYPLVVTLIAQVTFPEKANGSLLMKGDQVIGSLWIGQFFNAPQYFWGRPSATTPYPYNAGSSSGSNMGPSNPAFLASVKQRVQQLQHANNNELIPVDLVTASASGLDPDISPAAAYYQVARIAKERHVTEATIYELINANVKQRTLGVLGEPRVNVLVLNIALDELERHHAR